MTPADETSEARPVLAALRAVDKRFAGVHAVRSVTLELRAGEVHCLIGENGAGKSTVVKMLAGVHRPDGGRVELGGWRPICAPRTTRCARASARSSRSSRSCRT